MSKRGGMGVTKTLFLGLVIVFVGVLAYSYVSRPGSLQELIIGGIFDVGTEVAGEVVSAALHARTERNLTEANVRIIELEVEVRRRQEAERQMEQERAAWANAELRYLSELDTRKRNNEQLWETIESIHSQFEDDPDFDLRDFAPRTAAVFDWWMQPNPGGSELQYDRMRESRDPGVSENP